MIDRSNRPRLARAGVALGLLVGATAAIAARPQGATAPTTAPTTVQGAGVRTPGRMQDSVKDSVQLAPPVARDSVSAQGAPTAADSAQPSATQREAPRAAGTWPVDPATGLTLVNGTPVVGRVFVMQKTDGLRPYEGLSRHYVGEPLPPAPPTIGVSYRQPSLANTRRHRGMMVQSNLWSIETSRSAMETHHYRPMTTPAEQARR